MNGDFTGRCALITGANGNLGRAVAAELASRGARLALLGRDAVALRGTYGDDTPNRMCIGVDLLDVSQVKAALDTAVAHFGCVHLLCNLAGGFRMGEPVHETQPTTWDALWDLNVRTLLIMAQVVVPHLLQHGGGRIVNVGALSAQRGGAGLGAYAVTKAAIQRLTESMSAELKDFGINVNCVLPSIIDTPDNRSAMPDSDPTRWVAPVDLARVIAFLGSDDARAIHGVSLPVTGLS